jgi:hypothetical protein
MASYRDCAVAFGHSLLSSPGFFVKLTGAVVPSSYKKRDEDKEERVSGENEAPSPLAFRGKQQQ